MRSPNAKRIGSHTWQIPYRNKAISKLKSSGKSSIRVLLSCTESLILGDRSSKDKILLVESL